MNNGDEGKREKRRGNGVKEQVIQRYRDMLNKRVRYSGLGKCFMGEVLL